jgi:hypothetical protein
VVVMEPLSAGMVARIGRKVKGKTVSVFDGARMISVDWRISNGDSREEKGRPLERAAPQTDESIRHAASVFYLNSCLMPLHVVDSTETSPGAIEKVKS